MKNEILIFEIVKYVNGKYRIETPDIRFHWREGLLQDNLTSAELGDKMEWITNKMIEEFGIRVLFELK